ncbi:MAG: U32 family peptidase [Gloeomargaritaceae cyanobacterium C42_A2020_066]|nr:U32 family peptidase [Gloeomargaritaceae cyanobacterium C42_A2020_066]
MQRSPEPIAGRPELLAPAGDWDCARAAVENGADAIYFGLDQFNARLRAENFTLEDLPELVAFVHRRGVRAYLTLNTLVFTEELGNAEAYLRAVISAGIDGVIVQDVGLCRLIRHLSPDFPIHASTQMTITSAAGVQFAAELDCAVVVLARECAIPEIQNIQAATRAQGGVLPLEVFVHGALCVAYSGQCLTSEALGGRSANRGECAQACRMPYDLIVEGQLQDLGGRRYLLSPQDLAGLEVLPDLVQAGVASLKIEGRLKNPEYVASVTRIYRQALDQALAGRPTQVARTTRYELEMAFSRGLYTGWLRGIDNQALVHARYGKKRGVFVGHVTQVLKDGVRVEALVSPLKPGDGVVFDQGRPVEQEPGGRVYEVETQGRGVVIRFGRDHLNLRRIRVGDRLWKTSDPELDRHLRQTFTAEHPQYRRPLNLAVQGAAGRPLTVIAWDDQGHRVEVASESRLERADHHPLNQVTLEAQLGRLGNTPFTLGYLDNQLEGAVRLPVSELNRARRQVVAALEARRQRPADWTLTSGTWTDLMPPAAPRPAGEVTLIALARRRDQAEAALEAGVRTLYLELEDPRAYRSLVHDLRGLCPTAKVWVAPPRITKPGENWNLEQVQRAAADGYLVRNYDHLSYFAQERCVGDFSLNVANPLTASYFKTRYSLERLTASYDLNSEQLAVLLAAGPAHWYEVTLHQHMPLFHMEHCVFCAFLSQGTDYTNCGRPCEQYDVKLRDRAGVEHPLRADAGCRNTVFNGRAQTGAESLPRFLELGLRHVRVEFLEERPAEVITILGAYQKLITGQISGGELWRSLKLHNQLGVTRGSLGVTH